MAQMVIGSLSGVLNVSNQITQCRVMSGSIVTWSWMTALCERANVSF
jgi:hypothetical protein